MNCVEMRDQIQDYLDQLSPERLPIALDFLAYLVERETNEATDELLRIPGFESDLEEAERDAASNKLVDWRSIRDDV